MVDQKFVETMALAFKDELQKIASATAAATEAAKKGGNLLVPGLVAGSVGTIALGRAYKDWRMGRAMRMQQNY